MTLIRSMSPIVATMERTQSAAFAVAFCTEAICRVMSSVDCAVCAARLLTSPATTAKPRPASPARAASIVALSASRFVRAAMSAMARAIWPISLAWRESVSMLASASAPRWTAASDTSRDLLT